MSLTSFLRLLRRVIPGREHSARLSLGKPASVARLSGVSDAWSGVPDVHRLLLRRDVGLADQRVVGDEVGLLVGVRALVGLDEPAGGLVGVGLVAEFVDHYRTTVAIAP